MKVSGHTQLQRKDIHHLVPPKRKNERRAVSYIFINGFTRSRPMSSVIDQSEKNKLNFTVNYSFCTLTLKTLKPKHEISSINAAYICR